MLLDPTALDDVSDEVILEQTLDQPPVTIRDLQYTYGRLYTMGVVGESEYAQYVTPDAAREWIGNENSLVVVRVDVRDDVAEIHDVRLDTYTTERIAKVAHSKYSAARGMDHSVTHQTGSRSDISTVAKYVRQRFDRWAQNDTVQKVADRHQDGNIINAFAALGNSDDAMDSLEAEFRRAVQRNVEEEEPEDVSLSALVTVQIRREDGGDWEWPGELEVFAEAMSERVRSKLASKNEATDAKGHGVCMVTGEEGTVYGTTEDPLNYYLTRQSEKFSGFEPNTSWRSHPVSEDAALAINQSGAFLDACWFSAFGMRVYHFPYFSGEPTAEKYRSLFRVLVRLVEKKDDRTRPPLADAYSARGDLGDELRFYSAVIIYQQAQRFDVVGEDNSGTGLPPADLAEAHKRVLNTTFFQSSDGGAGIFPTLESMALLDPRPFERGRGEADEETGSDLFRLIASGTYFRHTFPDYEDAGVDRDPRVSALLSTLSGGNIDVGQILEEYTQRLSEHDTQEYGFPSPLIASQFAQLRALSHQGLLTTNQDRYQSYCDIDEELMPDEDTLNPTTDSEQPSRDYREERLQAFFDAHPPIRDDAERQSAFLIGALVGELSRYQRIRGKGRTLADQYTIDSLTRGRIKPLVTRALDKTRAYSSEQQFASVIFFDELVTRLTDLLQRSDPETDWEISTSDLRFHYGLGIAYGLERRREETEED